MSTAKKPVIVLVPGAWHSPIHFSPMTKLLQGAGYTVAGVDLPSVTWSTRNAPPPDSFDDDVQAVRTVILENAERGEDVLVLSHSYGSLPKMTAVKGLDKKTREAEGKKGGVVHLVFCASFALPEGVSLMNALNNTPLPWFVISDSDKVVNPATPLETFYNCLPSSVASSQAELLHPMAYKTFASPNQYTAFAEIPSTYILCEKDMAIPVDAQRGMVKGAEAAGVSWVRVEHLDTDHSPFVSMPEETAGCVRRAAGEVAA